MASQEWTVIIRDNQREVITIKRIDETGADIADYPQIQLDLAALFAVVPAASTGIMKPRLLQFKDASSCTLYQAVFLMTDPVTV